MAQLSAITSLFSKLKEKALLILLSTDSVLLPPKIPAPTTVWAWKCPERNVSSPEKLLLFWFLFVVDPSSSRSILRKDGYIFSSSFLQ